MPAAGGGGGCCGEEAAKTPDSIVKEYLPKLTETLLEILSEEPFNGMGTLLIPNSSGFKYKSEKLLTSILAFTLRVLGGPLLQKRKILIEKPKTDIKSGDSFDITVKCGKHAFMKQEAHSPRRIFICLVNVTDGSMYMQEGDPNEPMVETKFKVMPLPSGSYNFRAYVCSGDG